MWSCRPARPEEKVALLRHKSQPLCHSVEVLREGRLRASPEDAALAGAEPTRDGAGYTFKHYFPTEWRRHGKVRNVRK